MRFSMRVATLIVFLIPCVLYSLHAASLGGWLVDDAAISFAYARNVADGYGWVAQAGREPVEGYSNFLWVVLMIGLHWLQIFSLPITPKLVSLALVVASLLMLGKTLQLLLPHWQKPTIVACSLVALNTSFVVWTMSGLENPLLVFLVIGLLYTSVQIAIQTPPLTKRMATLSGVIVAAIALTRPDGLVYLGALLLVPFIRAKRSPAQTVDTKSDIRFVRDSLLAFAALYGPFLLFRWVQFHDIVPNTYWVKVSLSFGTVPLGPYYAGKLRTLFACLGGSSGGLVLVVVLLGTIYLIARRRFDREHLALLASSSLALSVYVVLPEDWMPECRFATPFWPLIASYSVVVVSGILDLLLANRTKRLALQYLVTLIAVVGALAVAFDRTAAFVRAPTVPITVVREHFLKRFEGYATLLDIPNPSILLPDVGGMLYFGEMQVYDLGGLTDRTIAATLYQADRPGFWEYVFESIQPTFIHMHGYYTLMAGFRLDPRFERDYIPICEYPDQWVQAKTGASLLSGDYVRRAAVTAVHNETLAALRDDGC